MDPYMTNQTKYLVTVIADLLPTIVRRPLLFVSGIYKIFLANNGLPANITFHSD